MHDASTKNKKIKKNNGNPSNNDRQQRATYWTAGQCIQIGRQYEIKNKAAIAFQCKLNGKIIAALLYILYTCLIWGYSQATPEPCSCTYHVWVL